MTRLGMHVRLTTTVTDALQQALTADRTIVQTFVMRTDGLYASLSNEAMIADLRARCQQLYIHLSYHVNLANDTIDGMRLLRKELELADRINATAVVLHPGAGSKGQSRQQALDTLMKNLDKALHEFPTITILLENAAHANRALGGNLQELLSLRTLTNYPERLRFCLDTAHAFVWGYDLNAAFCTEVQQLFGDEALALIHWNDTQQQRGSNIDQHAAPGTGTIGLEKLLHFAKSQQEVTLICENPLMPLQEERELLHELDSLLQ
ncbi:TIM barrel protein [Candidatus Dependentiae bacterium]|nr:TIM barrel protein [Candidatus Dependentiae bacterium]